MIGNSGRDRGSDSESGRRGGPAARAGAAPAAWRPKTRLSHGGGGTALSRVSHRPG